MSTHKFNTKLYMLGHDHHGKQEEKSQVPSFQTSSYVFKKYRSAAQIYSP